MTSKDFINLIKDYPEFELRFPVPDKPKDSMTWPSCTTFVPVEICDIGYSSNVLIIEVKELD